MKIVIAYIYLTVNNFICYIYIFFNSWILFTNSSSFFTVFLRRLEIYRLKCLVFFKYFRCFILADLVIPLLLLPPEAAPVEAAFCWRTRSMYV